MKMTRYKNVFDALESDPAVAENLKIRSKLMNELARFIDRRDLTRSQAAELLEVSQPRISDLVRGKIDRFTIDMLVNMLTRMGKHVKVKVSIKAAGEPSRRVTVKDVSPTYLLDPRSRS